MRKSVLLILGLMSTVYAGEFIKSGAEIQNVHGVVPRGTWFSLDLQNDVVGKKGTQRFSARLVDPIYNKTFSELLIPANATINGTYVNTGKQCSFEIDSIDFKGTEIDLMLGAYSTVDAVTPGEATCNPHVEYGANHHMEFTTKVNIEGLTPIKWSSEYVVDGHYTFIDVIHNSDYEVTDVTSFTNGLMAVNVKFNNKSIRNKLVPVYFDEYGIPHYLNYTLVDTQLTGKHDDDNTYLLLSHYNDFGFGVPEEVDKRLYGD